MWRAEQCAQLFLRGVVIRAGAGVIPAAEMLPETRVSREYFYALRVDRTADDLSAGAVKALRGNRRARRPLADPLSCSIKPAHWNHRHPANLAQGGVFFPVHKKHPCEIAKNEMSVCTRIKAEKIETFRTPIAPSGNVISRFRQDSFDQHQRHLFSSTRRMDCGVALERSAHLSSSASAAEIRIA